MKLYIGTSGYSYKHWANGVFYPRGLSANQWLEFYCQQFDTVELNVTFYRLPRESVFQGWYTRTPKDFRFVVKGSRYITHIKRLKDVRDSLDLFGKTIQPLVSKIRCVLWQFHPDFLKDEKRLGQFCEDLTSSPFFSKTDQVFEFRNETWFRKEIYDILRRFHYCLCFADAPKRIGAEVLTSDFVYLRFHGSSSRYSSDYTDQELHRWVRKIRAYRERVKAVYAYFNNDACGFAPKNARRFRALLGSG